jgi:hypothetical protein
MKIEFINTELGEQMVVDLKKEGWKVVKEYSWLAFDKGIDFDFYRMKKGDESLYFEWTNWFEWTIEGSEQLLESLRARYLRQPIA